MMTERIARDGLLVLPKLCIQNANAISSPLTHGFPSMTAFAGLMWALERKLAATRIDLGLDAVGVICHTHQEQTADGYVKTFRLTRNPISEKGEIAAIVEEGRMHLKITLIFSAFWKGEARQNIFLQDQQEARDKLSQEIASHVSTMRVAGGSIVSPNPTAQLLPLASDAETRAKDFHRWRRQWLPGFALVSRDDLLQTRLEQLQTENPDASPLDAWLDLSRCNWRSTCLADNKIKWQHDRQGWIVPIPVGYGALSHLHEAGTVRNARDTSAPFCFVESLHSIGEWISPHRLHDVDDLLWKNDNSPEQELYRLRNPYSPPAERDSSIP